MKKKPSKIIYYIDIFFDILGFLLHYGGLLLAIAINIGIVWLLLFKISFSFTMFSVYLYSIIFSTFFYTTSFFIHHYIYVKNIDIDYQVIVGKLSPSKASKIYKSGKKDIPTFKYALMYYMDFASLILFKKNKKLKLSEDIDIEKIPKNIKNTFLLFYISTSLLEIFFTLFVVCFIFLYFIDKGA